jgi:hypothetical protein
VTLTYSVQDIVTAAQQQLDLVADTGQAQNVFYLTDVGAHSDGNSLFPVPVLIETQTIFVGDNRAAKESEDADELANGEPRLAFIQLLNLFANDDIPYDTTVQTDESVPPPGDTGGGPAASYANGGQNAIGQLEGDIAIIESLFGQDATLDQLLYDLWTLPRFPFQ